LVVKKLREREREREREMGEERVKEEALRIMSVIEVLPRLVVFDLDYTLWPFYWFVLFFSLLFSSLLLFSGPTPPVF
jgi:hypothetical protein